MLRQLDKLWHFLKMQHCCKHLCAYKNTFVFIVFFFFFFFCPSKFHFYGLSIYVSLPWYQKYVSVWLYYDFANTEYFYWKTVFVNFIVGKWCSAVALLCISLISNNINIFPLTCLLIIFLFVWIVCFVFCLILY